MNDNERKQFEAMKADIAKLKEELGESRKELEETKKELDESEQLRRGTYYSLINDILDHEKAKISLAAINKITRKSEYNRYHLAIKAAKNWEQGEEIATRSGRSEYGSTSLTTETTTETDGTAKRQAKKLKGTAINGQQSGAAQIAHCLPCSTGCSSFAGPLIQAAVGVVFDDHDDERQQALIHGVLQVVETGNKKELRRKTGTGVKHYRDNMARIMHQAVYCDKAPSVLILPILELDKVLNPPEEYSALFVCKDPQIYKEMVMTEKCKTCTDEEIVLALARLNDFLGGAALCLFEKTQGDIDKIKSKEERAIIQSSFLQLKAVGEFICAKAKGDLSSAKVMKLTFANDTDQSKHSWIDPWLLLFKNATMYSAMIGLKLLPGNKFDDDCDDDDDDDDDDDEEEPGEYVSIPEYINIEMGPHEAS